MYGFEVVAKCDQLEGELRLSRGAADQVSYSGLEIEAVQPIGGDGAVALHDPDVGIDRQVMKYLGFSGDGPVDLHPVDRCCLADADVLAQGVGAEAPTRVHVPEDGSFYLVLRKCYFYSGADGGFIGNGTAE